MLDKPQIVQTAVQQTAIIRLTIPRAEIQKAMGPGYRELMAAVTAQGLTPTGAWFSHHLKMVPEIFDFEIGAPIAAPITPVGRVTAGQLPAVKVARAIYQGGYEGLGDAWAELMAWIEKEGHTPAPDLWEVYVAGPESGADSSTWRTELNRPLIG